MKKSKLLLIGAGGHAKVCIDIAERMAKWDLIELLDDNIEIGLVNGKRIIGPTKDILKYRETHMYFVAIGDNYVRSKIFTDLIKGDYQITTLIDPQAIISKYSSIGIGTAVMAGAIINANSTIMQNCIINTGSIIEHDCVLLDNVHISPCVTVCGSVHIGTNSWIGAGSVIKNNSKISKDTVVGAGSLVLKDVNQPGIYFGHPIKSV